MCFLLSLCLSPYPPPLLPYIYLSNMPPTEGLSWTLQMAHNTPPSPPNSSKTEHTPRPQNLPTPDNLQMLITPYYFKCPGAVWAGRANSARNASRTQGVRRDAVRNPGSATVKKDGAACSVTKVIVSFPLLVNEWISNQWDVDFRKEYMYLLYSYTS